MTDKNDKNDNEPLDPDSSSEILLSQMRKTYSDPEMVAVTSEEEAVAIEKEKTAAARKRGDTIPPWSSDEIRRQQILAWNAMAEAMIDVVKTIKTNEKKSDESDVRRRRVVYFVVAAAIAAVAINWRQGDEMIRQAAAHQQRVEQRLEASAGNQNKLLHAVAELAEAQALGIEAGADSDPAKEKIAKVQALEARKGALEAKQATETDPEQKAKTERKIEKVDEATEKAKADALPAPFD